MNHPLPHNEALLKLLAPGQMKKKERNYGTRISDGLINEPTIGILTMTDTDGTETQQRNG